MSAANYSGFQPSTLILIGFPGLEDSHIWFAAPLCIIYVITLIGNCTLILAIKTMPSLHKPMYLLISQLAVTDLAISSCIIPKMLDIFWFSHGEVLFMNCLVQMFFMTSLSALRSSTLTAMAFDRYIAVCKPLRYSCIITSSLIGKMAAVSLVRAISLALPAPILILRQSFCSRRIANSFCENLPVASLSCGDITVNSLSGVAVFILIAVIDNLCIAVSYIFILRAVFCLPQKKDRLKAFSTCSSHVSVLCVNFIPGLLSLALRRFPYSVPLYVHVIVGCMYPIIPALLDPLIYGGTMKEVRQGGLKQIQKIMTRFNLYK